MPTLSLFAVLLAAGADPTPTDYADLFPKLDGVMYAKEVGKPVVGKGEKPDTYKQTATYLWTGGRYENLSVTLARDPAFKEKYSAAALKKDDAAKEVEVGKKKAYLWELDTGGKIDAVARRLVVVLADDKAVIVEQAGSGKDLAEWAGTFDLDKMAKALDTPPAAK